MASENIPDQDAVEWARSFIHTDAAKNDPARKSTAEFILANAPSQKMSQVEWNARTHWLAGADSVDGESKIVLYPLADSAEIACADEPLAADDLVPNGRRYEIVEIKDDVFPRQLTSARDYDEAPSGTVVAVNNAHYMRESDDFWVNSRDENYSDFKDMAAIGTGTVLVWGHES